MEQRPIFVATHTRSCSTAFERVTLSNSSHSQSNYLHSSGATGAHADQIFMTRRDILTCFHEPFGDPFYFGPERISPASRRWPADKVQNSGLAHYTYDLVLGTIFDAVNVMDSQKRVVLKDMSYHIISPSHSPNAIAPSLQHRFALGERPNPTLFPTSLLHKFQFVFLIRNPSASIPSLYRCFIPPISEKTDEHFLDPTELGYRELRMLFDYLYPPSSRSATNTTRDSPDTMPILIDADDLLSHPEAITQSVCSHLGLPYSPSMLSWPTPEDHAYAKSLFDKYAGYHEDALNSTSLKPRRVDTETNNQKSKVEENQEWASRYGNEAAETIREAVGLCKDDYEYLRQFRIVPPEKGRIIQ